MDQYITNMNGVTVALRNGEFEGNWHDENSNYVIGTINDVKHNERIEIIPYQPKTGQYLKIWLPKWTTLYLCEVEVIRAEGKLFTYITVVHYLRLCIELQ